MGDRTTCHAKNALTKWVDGTCVHQGRQKRVAHPDSHLAKALKPQYLAERACRLYERFGPDIPKGRRGWRIKGELDLDLLGALAEGA